MDLYTVTGPVIYQQLSELPGSILNHQEKMSILEQEFKCHRFL